MEIKLDGFGRVVLPKGVRERLDLEAGDGLVLEEVDDGILLRPIRDEPPLVEKEGVLVFTGKPTEDPANTLEKLRTRRLRGLMDWNTRRR